MTEAEKTPARAEGKVVERTPEWHPLATFRHEMDRLFDDFLGRGRRPSGRSLFDMEPFWRGELAWAKAPAVDIAEKDEAYEITAELPGMEESDIDVKFADDVLTIKGEKSEEKEEKKKDYYLSERSYGTFQRAFRVPSGIDAGKIAASFKNGVLTVILPKTTEAQKQEKKIAIEKG